MTISYADSYAIAEQIANRGKEARRERTQAIASGANKIWGKLYAGVSSVTKFLYNEGKPLAINTIKAIPKVAGATARGGLAVLETAAKADEYETLDINSKHVDNPNSKWYHAPGNKARATRRMFLNSQRQDKLEAMAMQASEESGKHIDAGQVYASIQKANKKAELTNEFDKLRAALFAKQNEMMMTSMTGTINDADKRHFNNLVLQQLVIGRELGIVDPGQYYKPMI